MTNQCQDPTPEQEAMYAMQCEIDYLEEQLREVVRLIQLTTEEPMNPQFSQELRRGLYALLDQNAALAKAEAK